MLKKIFSLIKNKTGETVDAIVIAPVWIFILLIIAVQMSIYQAKQSLEDSAQIVSRYVMLSKNPDEAIETVNYYLNVRKDSNYFDEFKIENITKVYYKTGSGTNTEWAYTENQSDYNNYWEKGNMVEIVFKRKTPFYGSSALRFCLLNDNCFSVVEDVISTRIVVFLSDVNEGGI